MSNRLYCNIKLYKHNKKAIKKRNILGLLKHKCYIYVYLIKQYTMTKQAIITEINKKYEQDYKISKSGRIFREFMGKKSWCNFDKLVKSWENHELEKNSRDNVRIASEYFEKLEGVELTCKSMGGARYYDYKGYKVRISDHDWTSTKHITPDFNICSYKKEGHIEMITQLKNI